MAIKPGLCCTWSETLKKGFLMVRLILSWVYDVLERGKWRKLDLINIMIGMPLKKKN